MTNPDPGGNKQSTTSSKAALNHAPISHFAHSHWPDSPYNQQTVIIGQAQPHLQSRPGRDRPIPTDFFFSFSSPSLISHHRLDPPTTKHPPATYVHEASAKSWPAATSATRPARPLRRSKPPWCVLPSFPPTLSIDSGYTPHHLRCRQAGAAVGHIMTNSWMPFRSYRRRETP